jgi:hypothetical protein
MEVTSMTAIIGFRVENSIISSEFTKENQMPDPFRAGARIAGSVTRTSGYAT